MAKSDALAILNALSPKLGDGGSHLNVLDPTVRKLLDQIYTDIGVGGGGAVTADIVGITDTGDYFTGEDVEAALQELGLDLETINSDLDDKYEKPEGGIPRADLAADVTGSLDDADSAYQANLVEGMIESVVEAPTAAGTSYEVDDVLTIVQAGGSGGTVKVLTVDTGGEVLTVELVDPGAGYEEGSGLATTGGTGSGCTVEIDDILDHGIPYDDLEDDVQDSLDLADSAYQKPGTGIPGTDLHADVQVSLGLADTSLQPGEPVEVTFDTPVNALAADAELTISGVVIHGETVMIGDDVYEFLAHLDGSTTPSDPAYIAVDLNECVTLAFAQGTITQADQPTAGDTVTVGDSTYTFVPVGTDNSEGEVSVGTDAASGRAALLAALKGTDGHNTANTDVFVADEWAGNDLVLTAPIGGVIGNSIVLTETYTSGSNVVDGAGTLGTTTAGVDAPNTEASVELESVINASGTEPVTASESAGVVTITADVRGALANSIALDESMANGVWDDTVMTGGVDGTVADKATIMLDASYIYTCVDDNTVSDRNWRRVDLGSAY